MQGLLLCMANSAFAFFMFGYQVHEKAILLPLLPVTLLADAEPFLAAVLPPIAAFSMWPLLSRDGLHLAYLAALVLLATIVPAPAGTSSLLTPKHTGTTVRTAASGSLPSSPARANSPRTRDLCERLLSYALLCSFLGAVLLHAVQLVMPPLQRYPYLLDAMFTMYAFLHLAPATLYLNWRQWVLPGHVKLA